jgi:hypothetical protein
MTQDYWDWFNRLPEALAHEVQTYWYPFSETQRNTIRARRAARGWPTIVLSVDDTVVFGGAAE